MSQESSRNVSFYPLIWIHVRYVNMIFKYSDRQIFRRGVTTTHSRSATHRWGELFCFICQLCLSHPLVSLSCISDHHLSWYGPEFDLDVPAVASSTAPSGTFGPCHKNLTLCRFIRFVCLLVNLQTAGVLAPRWPLMAPHQSNSWPVLCPRCERSQESASDMFYRPRRGGPRGTF